jgi:hypothetical protein
VQRMTKRTLSDFDKRRIAAGMTLRQGVTAGRIMRRIELARERFWDAASDELHWEGAEYVERNNRRWVKLLKRPYASRGRPRKESVRRYVSDVVSIYKDATGRAITRIVHSGSDPRIGRQKRHPFLVACLKAAGIPTYPTGLIRQVLEEQ